MKNKVKKIFAFICFFIFLNNNLLSDEILFNTKEINFTENGSKVEALNGTAFSEIDNFIIEADRFLYDKNDLVLTAEGSFSKFNEINISIKSDFLEYKKKNQL